MIDPYQTLHDNDFSWDDVNAIAAVLAHHGFEIVPRAALEGVMADFVYAHGSDFSPVEYPGMAWLRHELGEVPV